MKHFLSIFFLLPALSFASNAFDGNDKYKHMGVSFGLGLASHTLIDDGGSYEWKKFALSMAPGVAKEVYDSLAPKGSGFSMADIAADMVGASLGVYTGYNILIYRQKNGVKVTFSSSF